MALTLTYIGTPAPVNIGATADITFPATAIGTAAADRWVLCVFWDTGDNQVPSGASIQGITATILYDPATAPHAPYWFIAKVPTLTQGDITIHTPGTQAGVGTVSVYTINGVPNLTPAGTAYFTGTGTTFNTVGISVTTKAGGVVVETFLNTRVSALPGMVWNANSPTMTNDMVNTALSTVGYMNTRSRQVATSGTQDGGNFSNNLTGTIRVSALSIAEQINADTATVLTSFHGVTQVATVVEKMPSTIATTLTKLSQAASVNVVQPTAIAMTLFAPTQAASVTLVEPSTIDQTLFGITQDFEGNVSNGDDTAIDQTLFGITQQITALMVPNANIDTTLFAPTMALNVVESIPSTIAQTLPGFIEEIDVATVNNTASIDMLLCATGISSSPLSALTYLGTSPISGNNITNTFTTINFGAVASNRWIIALISSATGPRHFVSVTINDVPAIKLVEAGDHTRPSAIYVANVPNSLDPNPDKIVVTQSGSNAMQCSAFSVYGNLDTTPIDSFTRIDNTTVESVNLNTRDGGVALGIASGVTAANTFFGGDFDTLDWKNATFGGGQGSHRAAVTTGDPLSVSVRSVGTVTTACAVSLGPVVGPRFGLEQVLNMKVSPTATIDQTLPGITQTINVQSTAGVIAQTLRKLTQTLSVTVTLPPGAINTDIDTTLSGLTQVLNVNVSPAAIINQTLNGLLLAQEVHVSTIDAEIDQTLAGFTQSLNVIEIIPTAIAQTLPGFTQEIDVIETIPTHIDQTLPGLTQEIDVESFAGVIDQTLPGFTQEINIVEEIVTFIDQTLLGFEQETDVIETDPPGVIGLHIDQTLPGFTQEIDVNCTNADITVELQGIRQRIDVIAPSAKRHERAPHAVPMPSKDMPIHPGELELFRRKVYGRAVDAMVPPPIIARNNLTTQRHPTSRPVVNRTPLGKKPS